MYFRRLICLRFHESIWDNERHCWVLHCWQEKKILLREKRVILTLSFMGILVHRGRKGMVHECLSPFLGNLWLIRKQKAGQKHLYSPKFCLCWSSVRPLPPKGSTVLKREQSKCETMVCRFDV